MLFVIFLLLLLIFSLPFKFSSIWLICVSAFYSLLLSCFQLSVILDLNKCFLSNATKVWGYYLFKYSLWPFLSYSFWTPIMWMLVHLMLSQKSLRPSTFLFFLFFFFFFLPLFCSLAVFSTNLSSCSLIRYSASCILLLIFFSVFFILIMLLSLNVCSLNLLAFC